ncbi:outer membrane protein assembly factor BamB family protein [Natrinema ejinorense]|uniref:Pyrrolo-quinoline quinone repeat domain-containing protein n=1 Tax=Natrinema ejinorense TaxID=373386 RepID=A0A2A5QQF9_9EURY|nr:PQQ-binding-like beta-propeller repeat protein [Natrinema ejinorense]PCR89015.1 hypothetical protein CP557_21355 [Natrinema ejinorense]
MTPRHGSTDPERNGRHERQNELHEGAREGTDEAASTQASIPRRDISDQMLRDDTTNADSWLTYNKGLEQLGYSPADRIDTTNVHTLAETYTLDTESSGLEVNPLVVPGDPPVMYYSVQDVWKVEAVNARTGEQFWSSEISFPEDVKSRLYAINRGVAVWGDAVYVATPVPSIVAFDRYTGEELWTKDLLIEEQIEDRAFVTQAPMAYDETVFVGQSSDYATFTTMSALDAETGEILWQRRTAPKDEWVAETWRYASASPWMSPAIDPETDTVLFSTGNPDPAFNGLVRPGPNRESCSVIAVDAKSGDVKWSTQISPHDLWDYDVHTTPQIIDVYPSDGDDCEPLRAVLITWKAGWLYLLDIETGRILERSPPFAKQGGPAFLSLPPAGEENAETMYPAIEGATEWPLDAYSPKTNLTYVGANSAGQKVWSDPDWTAETYDPDSGFARGGGVAQIDDEDQGSSVVAVDVGRGEIAWEHELQDTDPDWSSVRAFTGGSTATGGNVVFHGSPRGHLIALNAETGKRLWRDRAGGRITAAPVVWDDSTTGEQYVAVAADDRIVVYSSDGSTA